MHSNKISDNIRNNIKVFVYLNHNLSNFHKKTIRHKLISQRFILKKGSNYDIQYVSKENAAKAFIEETGENFWEILNKNPLKDMFSIGISQEFQSKHLLQAIKSRIQKIEGVYEVNYPEDLTTYINKNLNKVRNILWIFGIILFATVVIIIKNTIKLSLYSQRFLIRSMQLVGALPSFIKKPFLLKSFFTGLAAGILSSILILVILQYLNVKSDTIARLQNPLDIFAFLSAISLFGALLNTAATYVSINTYLKMSLDELY